jgi:hypothetical protein
MPGTAAKHPSIRLGSIPEQIINLPKVYTIIAGPTQLNEEGQLQSASSCIYNKVDLERWMNEKGVSKRLRDEQLAQAKQVCSRIMKKIHEVEKDSLKKGCRATMANIDEARQTIISDDSVDSLRFGQGDTITATYPFSQTDVSPRVPRRTGIAGLPNLDDRLRPTRMITSRVGHIEYFDYRDATVSEDGTVETNEKPYKPWYPTIVKPVIIRTPLTVDLSTCSPSSDTELESLATCSYHSDGIKEHMESQGLPSKVVEQVVSLLYMCAYGITDEVQEAQRHLIQAKANGSSDFGTEKERELLMTAVQKGKSWFDGIWAEEDGSRAPFRVYVPSTEGESRTHTQEKTRYDIQVNPDNGWLFLKDRDGRMWTVDHVESSIAKDTQNNDGDDKKRDSEVDSLVDEFIAERGNQERSGFSGTNPTILSVLGTVGAVAAGAATGYAISRVMGWGPDD